MPGPLPEGVTIRPFVVDVDGPAAFAVMNAAFTTHFGYCEETFEEWLDPAARPTRRGIRRSELVAELDGEIVGAQQQRRDRGDGYVFELGVLPEMQGRGIGRALLRHSFAMFAARGITKARLGVDTQNVTGAVELYRSVGMEPVAGAPRRREAHRGPARLLTPAERGPT